MSLAKLERAVARTHRAYDRADTTSTSTPGTDAEPAEQYADSDADVELDIDA